MRSDENSRVRNMVERLGVNPLIGREDGGDVRTGSAGDAPLPLPLAPPSMRGAAGGGGVGAAGWAGALPPLPLAGRLIGETTTRGEGGVTGW
jgi:hypothetical protein